MRGSHTHPLQCVLKSDERRVECARAFSRAKNDEERKAAFKNAPGCIRSAVLPFLFKVPELVSPVSTARRQTYDLLHNLYLGLYKDTWAALMHLLGRTTERPKILQLLQQR